MSLAKADVSQRALFGSRSREAALGHVDFAQNDLLDDLEWLQANDPRFQKNYLQQKDYAKFGDLFQFHSLCMDNLMQMFDLGGLETMIEETGCKMSAGGWWGEGGWVEAMNELSLKLARHHNLMTDIATMLAAYDDLDTRPKWFRDNFVGFTEGYFFSESTYSSVFSSKMELMYDLANSNKVPPPPSLDSYASAVLLCFIYENPRHVHGVPRFSKQSPSGDRTQCSKHSFLSPPPAHARAGDDYMTRSLDACLHVKRRRHLLGRLLGIVISVSLNTS
jgi:hypothetical protein